MDKNRMNRLASKPTNPVSKGISGGANNSTSNPRNFFHKKLPILVSIICSLFVVSLVITYAFFQTTGTTEEENISVSSGNMELIFSDGSSGFVAELEFGSSAEKTFTIKNNGSVDAVAKINWKNLINTYLEESLTYSLSYTDEESNTTEVISNENVPRSDVPTTLELANGINIPAGKTYTLTLTIYLNYLGSTDQTADLEAIFSSHFEIGEGEKPSLETTLKRLNIQVNNTAPNFNKLAPEPVYQDNGFPEGDGGCSTITGPCYLTYATSYKFDTMTGKFTLVNPQVAHYTNLYRSINGKYLASTFCSTNNALASYTNLLRIYQGTSNTNITSSKICTNTVNLPTLKEYNDAETGVHTLEDEYGTSYYYRGNVVNNYVKFGKWSENTYRGYVTETSKINYQDYESLEACENATNYNYNCEVSPIAGKDMFWRIIRINGNGSIRMIYDGTQAYSNSTSDKDRTVNKMISFNMSNGGYMYGTKNSSKEEFHLNEVDSDAKAKLDIWYRSNFLKTKYEKYISDEIFCSDRSTPGQSVTKFLYDTGLGYGSNLTVYGAGGRFLTGNNSNNVFIRDNPKPTFICPEQNDKYTVNNELGNKALTYPIGLITMDEAIVAGGKYDANLNPNNQYYLYKGANRYLTMSPTGYNAISSGDEDAFVINENGSIGAYKGYSAPVINLTKEAATLLTGDGSMDNPYHLIGE